MAALTNSSIVKCGGGGWSGGVVGSLIETKTSSECLGCVLVCTVLCALPHILVWVGHPKGMTQVGTGVVWIQ